METEKMFRRQIFDRYASLKRYIIDALFPLHNMEELIENGLGKKFNDKEVEVLKEIEKKILLVLRTAEEIYLLSEKLEELWKEGW